MMLCEKRASCYWVICPLHIYCRRCSYSWSLFFSVEISTGVVEEFKKDKKKYKRSIFPFPSSIYIHLMMLYVRQQRDLRLSHNERKDKVVVMMTQAVVSCLHFCPSLSLISLQADHSCLRSWVVDIPYFPFSYLDSISLSRCLKEEKAWALMSKDNGTEGKGAVFFLLLLMSLLYPVEVPPFS